MDLRLPTAIAALAGVGCLIRGARQRRWRWLTAATGAALLLGAAAILYLSAVGS